MFTTSAPSAALRKDLIFWFCSFFCSSFVIISYIVFYIKILLLSVINFTVYTLQSL